MKECEGIWLPDNDTHFAEHLRKSDKIDGKGTYQLKKIQAALKYVPSERRGLAVDVGAHIGLWSRVLAKYFEKVIAYEPVPTLCLCWYKNTPDNASLREAALSSEAGTLDIVDYRGNTGNSCVVAGTPDPKAHIIQANCYRMDDLQYRRTIDFLKIDVEGWEYYVVMGGRERILADKPVIVVEQKPNNAEKYGLKRTDAVKLLEGLGYQQMWEIAGDHCLVHKDHLKK